MVSLTSGDVNKTSSKKKRSFGFGAWNGDHNYDNNYYNSPFTSNDGYYLTDPHHHTHSHTLVTQKFGIPIPQPYPVLYPVKVDKQKVFFFCKIINYLTEETFILRFQLNDQFPFRFQFRFIIIIRSVFRLLNEFLFQLLYQSHLLYQYIQTHIINIITNIIMMTIFLHGMGLVDIVIGDDFVYS